MIYIKILSREETLLYKSSTSNEGSQILSDNRERVHEDRLDKGHPLAKIWAILSPGGHVVICLCCAFQRGVRVLK
jgi:hypothetical protein